MNYENDFSWLFFSTQETKVGNLGIGGNNPVRIQSMTNTPTLDTDKTVQQCMRIFDAGGELVRITARNISEATNLSKIRAELNKAGYHQPLAADIHFNPAIAIEAARRVEKIRINPGNFVNLFPNKKEYSEREYEQEINEICTTIKPLIQVCKENGTAVRIGINGGSLGTRIISKYGNTTKGMVESALEYINIFKNENFHNLVISIKASNVISMIHANRLLAQRCMENNFKYPIHLGVTEAGEGEDGRMKSALGIGSLLADGIGDTIRVSLTEAPENEIPAAIEIVNSAKKNQANKQIAEKFFSKINPFSTNLNLYEKNNREKPTIYTMPEMQSKSQNIDDLREKYFNDSEKPIDIPWDIKKQSAIDFSIVAGSFLVDGCGNSISINSNDAEYAEKANELLQISERKISRASFTSCPSCGRTTYDIEKVLKDVKKTFSGMTGVHFAVMGCIVNGPGEMAGAKYGILGSKENHVDIYVDGKPLLKSIPQDKAVNELKKIVEKNEKQY